MGRVRNIQCLGQRRAEPVWLHARSIVFPHLWPQWLGRVRGNRGGRFFCHGPRESDGQAQREIWHPLCVLARASMGVRGANLPAMARATVAIFWFGAQTYFASKAIALLLGASLRVEGGGTFLGMTGIEWLSFMLVWGFQVWLFWNGMERIRKFLNLAGPFVYAVMIASRSSSGPGPAAACFRILAAFLKALLLTTTARFRPSWPFSARWWRTLRPSLSLWRFFAFCKNRKANEKGQFLGLPGNIALFSLITLVVTAEPYPFWRSAGRSNRHYRQDGLIASDHDAAVLFFAATVGINLVANFVPPAYDLANLMPDRIDFRRGGMITAGFALVIGGLWASIIDQIGIFRFVDTLGAILAPVYGIMMVDFT